MQHNFILLHFQSGNFVRYSFIKINTRTMGSFFCSMLPLGNGCWLPFIHGISYHQGLFDTTRNMSIKARKDEHLSTRRCYTYTNTLSKYIASFTVILFKLINNKTLIQWFRILLTGSRQWNTDYYRVTLSTEIVA